MQRRFVIQIHSGWGPTHFDLMIEEGDALATWQLDRCPWDARDRFECLRIADHRRAYLDYEGPVSRGRGRVDIHTAGVAELTCFSEDRLEGVLVASGERRPFGLVREEGDQWLLVVGS
ncbi:MAG: hypothetical protein ACLFV7_11870 [Phycisphaerae bacterium]